MLNEKGFQQTLAELAGASARPTRPTTVTRTVERARRVLQRALPVLRPQDRDRLLRRRGLEHQRAPRQGPRRRPRPTPSRSSTRSAPSPTCPPPREPYADALADRERASASARRTCPASGTTSTRPYAWSLATDGTIVSPSSPPSSPSSSLVRRQRRLRRRRAQGPAPQVIGTLAPENSWYQESVEQRRARSSRRPAASPGYRTCQYVLDLGTMSNQAAQTHPRPQEPRASPRSSAAATRSSRCSSPAWRTASSYYPEFIIVGTALTDADIVGQLWNQKFASHAFGVSPLDRLRAADPDDRLRRPTSRCARRRAGLLRRPHLLPDVHAGDRPPDGRARTSPRRPSRRACSTTRPRPARSGCGTSAPATTPPPTTSARSTGTRTPSRPTTARRAPTSASTTAPGTSATSSPAGPFPRPQ